ncbi:hypothetical protein HAL07_10130 [Helicobacter ailurogastricus]|uniref:Uncharacterized protein n=1 Tax=Helicobacter ailurogastricus TaxID=1578720 RepID=A0A0K2Y0U9_9HELI|nr:hypothetical protein HAL07_10130 [Helicobacter ailurogastricus]
MSFDTALLAFFCGCMRVYKPVYVPTMQHPQIRAPLSF